MSELNLDYAKNLDLSVRRNGLITVTIDCGDFDFSPGYVEVELYRASGMAKTSNPFKTVNSDDDTDYITVSDSVVTIKFRDALTSLQARKYFWLFRYVDANEDCHIWLVGDYEIIGAKSDEDVTDTTLTISITEPSYTVNLTIQANISTIFYSPEDLTGTKNGVNTAFTLPHNYKTDQEIIIFNGRILKSGTGYTRSGTTITMLSGYVPTSLTVLQSMGVV